MENHNCHDYVTEKFYIGFEAGVIPIVDGTDDYSTFVPSPHSIIEPAKFQSVKALADHLKYLTNNRTAYYEYMPWKFDPEFKLSPAFEERMKPIPQAERHLRRLCEIWEAAKIGYRNIQEIPDDTCIRGRYKTFATPPRFITLIMDAVFENWLFVFAIFVPIMTLSVTVIVCIPKLALRVVKFRRSLRGSIKGSSDVE